jgi:hypothetical protein
VRAYRFAERAGLRVVGSPTPRPAGPASRPSQASRACADRTRGAGSAFRPQPKRKRPAVRAFTFWRRGRLPLRDFTRHQIVSPNAIFRGELAIPSLHTVTVHRTQAH